MSSATTAVIMLMVLGWMSFARRRHLLGGFAMAPHCMTSSQRSQPGELGDLGVALGLSSKALSCICYMAFFVPAFHIAFQVVYSICIR